MNSPDLGYELSNSSDDLLAAEYVLGVLSAGERLLLTNRMEMEPNFARLVGQWEERLFPISEAITPVAPPSSVKHRLDKHLFGQTQVQLGLWSRLGFWRALTGLTTAALLIVAIAPRLQPVEQRQHLATSLTAPGGAVTYLVLYDAAKGNVNLAHLKGAPTDDHDFELWIAKGSDAPISLGVIPAAGNAELEISEPVRALLTSASHMAISLEPRGGSPTGQPTGPVLASGDLHEM